MKRGAGHVNSRQRIREWCLVNEIHVGTEIRGVDGVGGGGTTSKANMSAVLTQGGSLYDITVGTVVNVDVHRMMLFYLHTTGDRQEIKLPNSPTFCPCSHLFSLDS